MLRKVALPLLRRVHRRDARGVDATRRVLHFEDILHLRRVDVEAFDGLVLQEEAGHRGGLVPSHALGVLCSELSCDVVRVQVAERREERRRR